MGPIGVKSHLAPFVPGHSVVQIEGMLTPSRRGFRRAVRQRLHSADQLDVYPYDGRRGAETGEPDGDTERQHIATRLKDAFPVLYTGRDGRTLNVFWIFVR